MSFARILSTPNVFVSYVREPVTALVYIQYFIYNRMLHRRQKRPKLANAIELR